MKTLDEFINEIDLFELRRQKRYLYELCEWLESKRETESASYLEGIINLLDKLQDYAVDEMGMDGKNVFIQSED